MPATRFLKAVQSFLFLLGITAVGCGPAGIKGGTPGQLTSDGNPIRDVEVSLYPSESGERIGYGLTGPNGVFRLIKADSSGSLILQPGSYTVTLESVGAPVDLPAVYLDRQTTPLEATWPTGDRIELNIPGLKLRGNS